MIVSLLKFLLNAAILILVLIGLYLFAFDAMWISKQYTPEALYPQQYNAFKKALYKDATSRSSTAKTSQDLYIYLRDKDMDYNKPQESTQQKSTTAKQDDATDAEQVSPIDKAKQRVDEYNQSIQERDKILDQL